MLDTQLAVVFGVHGSDKQVRKGVIVLLFYIAVMHALFRLWFWCCSVTVCYVSRARARAHGGLFLCDPSSSKSRELLHAARHGIVHVCACVFVSSCKACGLHACHLASRVAMLSRCTLIFVWLDRGICFASNVYVVRVRPSAALRAVCGVLDACDAFSRGALLVLVFDTWHTGVCWCCVWV